MDDDLRSVGGPGRAGVPLPVLVAGADSPTGLSVARALRAQRVPIVGLARDPGSPPTRSSAWHEIVAVPDDSPAGWLATLAGVAARYGRMALLPACDDVVAIVGEHGAALRADFAFVASPPAVVRGLLDKTEFHEWAVRHGFPVPRTEIVGDPAELLRALARFRYPAVLKPCERTPAWQAASPRSKAYVLTSAADAALIPFDLFAVSPRYVVQEWIPGRDSDVYFCLVYRDRDGRELGSRVGRKIVQWPEGTGNTALCVTADDPELHALTTRLFDAAGMVGLGSVEFKRSPVDGRPYITEPTVGRPNLQSGVARAAGTDLVTTAYRDAVGLPPRAGVPRDRAAWVHEGTLIRALAVSGWRGRLDAPAVVGALCVPSPRGAAFAARGDLTPLGREILRQARVLRRVERTDRSMSDRRLRHVYDIADLRRLARRRLPRAVFEVIEGGTGDQITVGRNREAFARIALRPRALVDVAKVDTTTTILGEPVSMPLMLAPCSFARMCHSTAEPAVARAAHRAGTVYAVPTGSSEPLDRITGDGGPRWFQLYMNPDRQITDALLDRVQESGCRTLCVTIDTAIKPYREHELRNRISMPLKPSGRLLMTGLSRPMWARDFLLGRSADGSSRLATAGARLNPLTRNAPARPVTSATASLENFADAIRHIKSVTADDIAYLRERWSGPLVVKGILRHEEVPALLDLGVDGLVVSNHGGRNLDTTPATVDVLGEVVDAAAGRAEVFLDSGVRRGTDVVKALALGARAVLVGRPYLYGLAAGGEAGVDKALQLLHDEIARVMSQLGAGSVDEVDASLVTRTR